MKSRILHIIAVLGVLFLIPAFGYAKSAPASSIEKMQFNGDYSVQVYSGGKWFDAGKLSFGKHYSDKTVDIGRIISDQQSAVSNQQSPTEGAKAAASSQQSDKGTVSPASGGLSPAQVILVRLVQKGGGAAHIDSIFLGGSAPIKISQEKDEEFFLKKLSKKDYDVIDAFGKTIELAFPTDIKDMTLKLTARVEATAISKTPFQFPLDNLYKKMDDASKFYSYKLSRKSEVITQLSALSPQPFFKEFSVSGSGHPSGYTYGWVGNDDENLLVKIDFTGDNTMDGDKDYAKVYVKTGSGIKEFKVSVPETKWGAPSFIYTDRVEYQHKVYDFKIPLKELGPAEELQLAFAAYGTFAPPPAGEFNYLKNHFLVVYDEWLAGSNYDVYGKIVDSEGKDVVPEFVIHSAPQSQYEPAVAYDGINNRFLVVWHDNTSTYDIHGRFVNADGSFPGDAFVISNAANNQFYPSVAYDSTNQRFLVVWYDFRNGVDYDIYGQLVNADGTLYNTASNTNFVISNAAGGQYSPSVSFDKVNQRFLVVWADSRGANDGIYGQLMNTDGTLYNTASNNNFVISNAPASKSDPSVAYDSSSNRFLVAWRDGRNDNDDVYGQIVNADGTLTGWTASGDNFVISNTGSNKYGVALASDSINRRFLAVWTDNRAGNYDIYGQVVNADGTLYNNGITDSGAGGLQNDNFVVKNASGSAGLPGIASNSSYTNFLVSFKDGANVLFAVVGGILVPVTSQANCYDAAGKMIACSNTGQDGDIQAGVAFPTPRFTNPDGATPVSGELVLDKLTGLMWARDAGVPVCSGFAAGPQTWQNAIEHVNCLNSFNSYGHNDWRLPNINELASVANYGEKNVFSWLGGQGFLNMQSGYWSSTTNEGNPSVAWTLGDSAGTLNSAVKTIANTFYVLPVRDSGQNGIISLPKTGQTFSHTANEQDDDGWFETGVAWPAPRFTDNSNGTVSDNLTGLTWMKFANAPEVVGPPLCSTGTKTWQDALSYVACLNTNSYLGFNDWRLPNNLELRGLINYGQNASSIWLNGQGFMNVQGNYYWSSVSKSSSPAEAWAVNMTDGTVFSYSKANSRYVWPVRGGAMEYPVMTDVSVSMSGTPGPVSLGTAVNYVLTLTNNGPGIARSIFLGDTLPGGAAYVSSTPAGTCENSGLSVNCGLGNMGPAATVVLNVNATLNTAGINNNAATVSLSNDSEPANNSSSWPITVVQTLYALTVSKSGTGSGTVTAPLLSINCGADCSEVYASGTVVTLTAASGADSVFTGWTGCESPSGNQCLVTMDRVESVTANFNLTGYNVVPSAGTGGSLSPNTSQTVVHGATASFIVTPDPGYHIASVTGCGGLLSVSDYTTGPVTADCTVSATFELNTYALTVSKAGTGTGTVTGAGTYGHGSSVNVTATADTGSIFTGWSGDCSGAVSPTAVIMDKAKTCTATFAINAYALTVSKAGTGSGTVTGAGTYTPGSIANVTASADANSAFTGWGGDCSGPDNPAAITMDSAKTCVANFAFSYYSLIINKTGEGTITPNPPGMNCTAAAGGDCYKYNKGQNVVLIARAEKDYVFKGWSSCTGTGPCKLELDADKTVTAGFEAVFPKLSISIDGTDLVPGADNYLEFDKVRVGRLKTKTLKVTNSGNGNLSISGQIEGADMDMFSRKMGSMVTIRPGKSYNIRVTFKPSSTNEKAAELIISSNDPEVPSFRIDLGGEGFIKKK